MAPARKRTTARAKVAAAKSADSRGKYAPLSANTSSGAAAETSSGDALSNLKDDYFGFDSASGFRISKKDKRTIKHGNLLNKVREAGISKEGSGKKRRRPAKKLKADMSDLGDALPDVSDEEGEDDMKLDDEDDWEGVSENEEEGTSVAVRKGRRRRRKAEGDGNMVMKSLKHRPGAMKKRKVLEERERERFGRNLAQLVNTEGAEEGIGSGADTGDTQTQKWAALRAFIGGTMQKDKAFAAV